MINFDNIEIGDFVYEVLFSNNDIIKWKCINNELGNCKFKQVCSIRGQSHFHDLNNVYYTYEEAEVELYQHLKNIQISYLEIYKDSLNSKASKQARHILKILDNCYSHLKPIFPEYFI